MKLKPRIIKTLQRKEKIYAQFQNKKSFIQKGNMEFEQKVCSFYNKPRRVNKIIKMPPNLVGHHFLNDMFLMLNLLDRGIILMLLFMYLMIFKGSRKSSKLRMERVLYPSVMMTSHK